MTQLPDERQAWEDPIGRTFTEAGRGLQQTLNQAAEREAALPRATRSAARRHAADSVCQWRSTQARVGSRESATLEDPPTVGAL